LMDCPRCGTLSHQPVSRCGVCGLSLELLSQSLGSSLVSLESLTDAAHCLRVREREQLTHELDTFQQSFPQVFLGVYLGILPTTPTASEIAFWLLNQAAFQPGDPARLNERAALLIVDPVARSAGLTVGYGLEPFLPRHRLAEILRRIRTPLWHGEYSGAIELCIRLLAKALRKGGRRSTRQVEFPPPGTEVDFIQKSGLHSLRDPEPALSQTPEGGPNPSDHSQLS
jgi:uncharacterized membrane protein YgcG